jgi:hypothetical protein
MKVKWTSCKYCGARLRRDVVGQYCPTRNCQWHHGLPASEDSPKNRTRNNLNPQPPTPK